MVNITGTLPGDDGNQYNISIQAVSKPATATSVVVSAAPASPQPVGTSVTFTATVSPSNTAGIVTFSGTGNSTPVPVVNGVATQTITTSNVGTLSVGAAFAPADPKSFQASTATAISYTVSSGEAPLTGANYSTSTTWAWANGSLMTNAAGNVTQGNDQYGEFDFAGVTDNDHVGGMGFRVNGTSDEGISVCVGNSKWQIEADGFGHLDITRTASTSGHARVEVSGTGAATVVKLYIGGTLIGQQTLTGLTGGTGKSVRPEIWQGSAGVTVSNLTASSLGAVPPQTVPSAPTLTGTTGASGQAVLSWGSSTGATSYKIFQAGTQIATTSNLTYTVTGLTNGTAYSFTVKASNSAGDSAASNSVSVTPVAGSGGVSGTFLLGAAGTGAGNGALDRWMTNGPGIIQAFATWSDNQSYGFTNLTNEFGTWAGVIDVAIGAIWNDSWANAANGAWDSYWRQKVTDLKNAWGSRDPRNMRIRFAHEFNGNWMPWSVSGSDSTAFKNAFARFAGIARSVMPGALIVFSPNDGSSNQVSDVTQYWPGTQYADRCGVDSYNQYPHAVSSTDVQTYHFTSSSGFETWRQRCATWGVTMCVPEWANAGLDSGGDAGGGEAPNYVTAVFNWAKTNAGVGAGKVEYACYFNIAQGYAAHFQLFDGSGADSVQPQTAAAFRAYTR